MARVLVADDEPKLGGVVTQMLQLDGHEVLRVGGGQEAVHALSAGRFDVVVTDLRMPGLAGTDLARRVKEIRGGPFCGPPRNSEVARRVAHGMVRGGANRKHE